MTDRTARAIANSVLAGAAACALIYVWRTPRLRRLAMGVLRTTLTTTIPAYLAREVQQAWSESARTAACGPAAIDHL
jgi:hypothetical protein